MSSSAPRLLQVWAALAAGGVLLSSTELMAHPPAYDPEATSNLLEVSILDENGRPTPARVELLDAQGTAYIADDALLVGGDSGRGTSDLEKLPTQTLQQAMAHFATRKITNWYTRTEQFYADGAFHVSLPAGSYTLRVFKGLEYRIARKQFEVPPHQTTKLTVKLDRWMNLPEQGWYSGESHVHIARPYKELNRSIAGQMQAEDLHVTNLLQWGHARAFHNAIQYAHGPEGVHQDGDYLLVSGQENPRTPFLGHTLILGTRSPINFPDTYLLFHQFWEEARRQNALSGWAHFAQTRGGPAGIAIDLLDGLLAVIEVIQFDRADYDIWYDALNLGFRLTPIAGTDYMPPTSRHLPGRERFYTFVQGPLTYESWLDGVRRGRTIASNGPMLELAVEGRPIGDEIFLRGPGSVQVEGSVRFDPERDDIDELELVVNGDVVRTFTGDGKQGVISCRFSYPVSETCWMALRVSGDKRIELSPYEPNNWRFRDPSPAVAHTAPIYVTVDKTPGLASQDRAKIIARKWLGRLLELENQLMNDDTLEKLATLPGARDQMPTAYLLKMRDELLQRIGSAKTRFQALAR